MSYFTDGRLLIDSDGSVLIRKDIWGIYGSKRYKYEYKKARGAQVHRLSGPATGYYFESETYEGYVQDGMFHRENGPAKVWFKDDKVIREEYYQYGERHRLDGPAIVGEYGLEYYYIEGVEYKTIKAYRKAVQVYLGSKDPHKNMGDYK